jgi:hypothetical protein
MTTHFSVDFNYMPLCYPVNLSRVLATIQRILVNYRFEDRSEILDVPYSDEMNHMALMDLACVLSVNSQNNPDLAWMTKIQEDYKNVYNLSENGLEDTEAAMRSMYANLNASRPENFDCQLEDHCAVLYDYYSPESTSVFKEN